MRMQNLKRVIFSLFAWTMMKIARVAASYVVALIALSSA